MMGLKDNGIPGTTNGVLPVSQLSLSSTVELLGTSQALFFTFLGGS